MPKLLSLLRLAVALVVTYAATYLTWRLTHAMTADLAASLRRGALGPATTTPDELVADLAATLLLVAVGVFGLLVTSSATALLLRDRSGAVAATVIRWSRRIAPLTIRRLVAAVCGIGLAAPVCLGTAAVADDGAATHRCVRVCAERLDILAGLPFPDLPTSGRARRPDGTTTTGAPHRTSVGTVRVHPGDSLWLIARSLAPADASDAVLAELTDRLYGLNRSVVGPDPDVILPGMILQTPKGTS